MGAGSADQACWLGTCLTPLGMFTVPFFFLPDWHFLASQSSGCLEKLTALSLSCLVSCKHTVFAVSMFGFLQSTGNKLLVLCSEKTPAMTSYIMQPVSSENVFRTDDVSCFTTGRSLASFFPWPSSLHHRALWLFQPHSVWENVNFATTGIFGT